MQKIKMKIKENENKTTFNFGYSCTQNAPKYIQQSLLKVDDEFFNRE